VPETWPSAAHRPRLDAIRKARAWYSGERLIEDSGTTFWRRGGGKSKEWNEGVSLADDEKVHVPVAADLALTASDFLFAAGVEYLTDDDQALMAEADELAGLTALLPLGAEKASGMGEAYIRLGWDADRPLATLVDADRVLPTFRWGRLVRAVVWSDLPDHDSTRWRHLEIYERGVIRHELWRRGRARAIEERLPDGAKITTETDEMETRRPLSDHPETADLEPEVPLPTGMANRLALLYVANAEPRTGRSGGRSDTEGSEGLMAGLDMTISALLRDVDLAKARILVDENMLTRTGKLKSAFFDTAARVFAPVGSVGMEGNPIKVVQFDVRARQHLETAGDLLHRIVSAAGYSPDSLSVVQSNLPEAAAARRARERASLRTTERKAARWRPVIAEALSSLAVIHADLTDRPLDVAPRVTVTLRSSMAPDFTELATAVAAARGAEIVSDQTAVRELHPTWTKDAVLDEVAKIVAGRVGAAEDVGTAVQRLGLGVKYGVLSVDEARDLLPNLSGTAPADDDVG
jgi:hypothetical protein